MIAECEVLKQLPSGGQKRVELAKHPSVGLVVIKRGEIKSFASLERIKREVELLSELDSHFYPKQHHFNIDVKSKEFQIVEDYIEGKVLRDCFNEFNSPEEIFNLLLQLISGLSVIWDRNVVHRDLKPENIIIRSSGTPCIIDLGIARFLEMDSLTKTIAPFGPCTPLYSSPEQLSNNKAFIDPRTDFYCLGIIALELYLKSHPFDPSIVGGEYSIVENIGRNQYELSTKQIAENEMISEFARRVLQPQPYQRFRNYHIMQDFILNLLSR